MGTGPLYPVDGPLPVAPLQTLISVAQIVDEPTERWANGLNVRPYPCGTPDQHDPCSTGTDRVKTVTAATDGTIEVAAFTAVLGIQCGRRGQPFADLSDRVMAAFAAREHIPVEANFWDTNMADAALLGSDGTAYSLVAGLGYLEDALIGRGIIHVTPSTLTALASAHLVERDNEGRLVTPLGNYYVPGQGYPGTGPTGKDTTDPDEYYAMVTGMVQIRRDQTIRLPDIESQALDRSTNDLVVYAERDYATSVDLCTHAAVRLDICTLTCT